MRLSLGATPIEPPRRRIIGAEQRADGARCRARTNAIAGRNRRSSDDQSGDAVSPKAEKANKDVLSTQGTSIYTWGVVNTSFSHKVRHLSPAGTRERYRLQNLQTESEHQIDFSARTARGT
jgi:hypothetical protein